MQEKNVLIILLSKCVVCSVSVHTYVCRCISCVHGCMKVKSWGGVSLSLSTLFWGTVLYRVWSGLSSVFDLWWLSGQCVCHKRWDSECGPFSLHYYSKNKEQKHLKFFWKTILSNVMPKLVVNTTRKRSMSLLRMTKKSSARYQQTSFKITRKPGSSDVHL